MIRYLWKQPYICPEAVQAVLPLIAQKLSPLLAPWNTTKPEMAAKEGDINNLRDSVLGAVSHLQ